MAGVCGHCGALLKSVEEAQEHAELTSCSNFSESTEAVLNLVCTSCGKPCQSKTESNLHTKRIVHTEFSDKTLEADGNDAPMDIGPSTSTQGNNSVEAVFNGAIEHEDDPEIDQMAMKPRCSDSSLPDGYPRLHHEGSFKAQAGKATKPSIATDTNGPSDQIFRNTSSKKSIFNDSSLADGCTHLHLEESFKVQGGKDTITKASIATDVNVQSDRQLRNNSSKGCYCFPWCGN